MRNNEHLRVCQARTKDVLDSGIGGVVEVGGTLVHDEEGARAELEQAASEREQLPLSLTCGVRWWSAWLKKND